MRTGWLRPAYTDHLDTEQVDSKQVDTEHGDARYATVYLDATRADESGASEVELRWAAARRSLADAGAPDVLLDAMQERALAPTGVAGRHGLLLVGTGARVVFHRTLPHPPARESASWSATPHLLPLLRQEWTAVPYALVLADRQGADITVVGPHREQLAAVEHEGSHDVIRKVPQGGWSAARYQRRAEDSWERNAAEIAAELDAIVVRHGLHLVLVGGDVRAVAALLEQVSQRTRDALVELQSGGRADGAPPDALADEVREIVVKKATAESMQVVDRFAQERGRGAAAVEGLPAVVDAVRRGQVEALLLHDDPSSTATLLIGPEPLQLATTPGELEALGAPRATTERADAALLRGLVATDADLVFVPSGAPDMQDGIGALLRYADASTGT